MKFYLPLPDRVLSPNIRSHFMVKAKAVKAARAAAKAEVGRVLDGAPAPLWGKASYVATFFLLPKHRDRDPDNSIASLKAYIDGIADGGVIQNDRNLWPERPVFIRTDKMPRVEIVVTPE